LKINTTIHGNKNGVYALNTFAISLLQTFHAKTAELHMALRERNSGAKCARGLFKCSKDLAKYI